MKKKVANVVKMLFAAAFCSMLTVQPAFAAERPSVVVPVEISLSGTLPKPAEEFAVKMKAEDAAFPMPEGAEDGIYTMTMTGEESKNTPAIAFDKLGIYKYTIWQEAGENQKCTYDDTVYELTVYVTNAEDGSGLELTAVLYPDVESDKLPGAVFENVYETEPEPKPEPEKPQTGDHSNAALYLTLIAVSGAVVVLYAVARRRKKSEE